MPISSSDLIGQNETLPDMRVSLEPVINLIYSLELLIKEEHMPGLRDWVIRTKDAMSLEERLRHRLVMIGLFYSFIPDTSWQSFAGYIDHLASRDPRTFLDRMLGMYLKCHDGICNFAEFSAPDDADKARILASEETYLAFLTEHFHDKFDPDLEAQAYRYAADPPAMKELIVGHMRSMWDKYLEPEWSRNRRMLAESVNAFQAVDVTRMSRQEAMKAVTGRESSYPGWEELLKNARRVVFVPNAHIGPYLGKIVSGSSLMVIFGARLPEGAHVDAVQELTRTEIVTRLSALADDGRLRILRMAADAGELRAPDVMVALDISQSAASRHLTQLTANGYLTERRREGGKSYIFNSVKIADALGAISQYLRLAPGPEARGVS
jgi:DNA-binding transcriptional ArsR family regulator